MAQSGMQADYKIALECGLAFVKDYYLKYAQSPEDLAPMYGDSCLFCHHGIGETPVRATGVREIMAYLRQYIVPEGRERKVTIHDLDSMPSMNGAVLVLAKGRILTKHSTQEFSQSFLLAKLAKADVYCINNDMMQLGVKRFFRSHGKAAPAAKAPAGIQGSPPAPPPAASPKQTREASAPAPTAVFPTTAMQQVERCAAEQPPKQPEATAPMSGAKGGAPTAAPAKKQQQQQQQPKPVPLQPAAQPAPEHGGKPPLLKEDVKKVHKEAPHQKNKQRANQVPSAWDKPLISGTSRQLKNRLPAKKTFSNANYFQMGKKEQYDVHFPALGKVSSPAPRRSCAHRS